jgi:hypothetical protein
MRDCVGVVVVLVLALALLALLAFLFLKETKEKGNTISCIGDRKNVNRVNIPFHLI